MLAAARLPGGRMSFYGANQHVLTTSMDPMQNAIWRERLTKESQIRNEWSTTWRSGGFEGTVTYGKPFEEAADFPPPPTPAAPQLGGRNGKVYAVSPPVSPTSPASAAVGRTSKEVATARAVQALAGTEFDMFGSPSNSKRPATPILEPLSPVDRRISHMQQPRSDGKHAARIGLTVGHVGKVDFVRLLRSPSPTQRRRLSPLPRGAASESVRRRSGGGGSPQRRCCRSGRRWRSAGARTRTMGGTGRWAAAAGRRICGPRRPCTRSAAATVAGRFHRGGRPVHGPTAGPPAPRRGAGRGRRGGVTGGGSRRTGRAPRKLEPTAMLAGRRWRCWTCCRAGSTKGRSTARVG
eukprot:SAG22_NODE_2956_length_2078_cov_1.551794_2_plen_351_part_00